MTIKVHHLRPAPGPKTAKTRVGRGEGVEGQDRPVAAPRAPRPATNVPAALRGWADAHPHAAAEAARASRTRSRSSTRWSTWTGSPSCSPSGGAGQPSTSWSTAGAVRKGQPRQGARHRRARRRDTSRCRRTRSARPPRRRSPRPVAPSPSCTQHGARSLATAARSRWGIPVSRCRRCSGTGIGGCLKVRQFISGARLRYPGVPCRCAAPSPSATASRGPGG